MTVVAGAQASDPVKATLDKAVTTYAAEMKAFRAKAGAWLDEREKAARQAGDKKAVDRIKLEREVFGRTDDLPATASKEWKQHGADALAKLVRAYAKGVKDYTRAGMDKEAAALERELELVKAGIDPADKRRRWVHPKGAFRIVRRGVWEESHVDGVPLTWSEVGRTKEHVELTVTLEGKRHYVRLYETGDGRRSEDEMEFNLLFMGKWVR